MEELYSTYSWPLFPGSRNQYALIMESGLPSILDVLLSMKLRYFFVTCLH